ncbi:MAG: thermonuclease family protein [Clostridia bacterium]
MLIALLLPLLVTACGGGQNAEQLASTKEQTESGETSGRVKAEVIKAVDGDTIKVKLGGKETTVRFLLVDTPETKHPKLGEQPFGKEASQFVKALLEKKTVELEQDVTPGPDKYGRMLFYVYVDGKSVQEMLLEKGLARVAYVYVPNVKYVDKYRAIQEKAQKAGVGIWSIENYAQEDGFHAGQVKEPDAAAEQPEDIDSQTPGIEIDQQPTTPEGKQEVFYNSCKEARAAGATPLRRGEPGYRPEMDGDKDGIACE